MFGADPSPANLEALAEAGVDRAVLGLPIAGPDEVRRALDRAAALLS